MQPPKNAIAFLRWFCREDYLEEIEGDLIQVFRRDCKASPLKAKWKFTLSVLRYFRPAFMKSFNYFPDHNSYAMYKSYMTIAWRNLLRSKGYSVINISGLATGMTVALFIGLWIYDELSFNMYHSNYRTIAQVYSCETSTATSEIQCSQAAQMPLGIALRNNYPQYFKRVITSWWVGDFAMVTPDKKINRSGLFIEPGALEMLSLKMLQGSYQSLDHQNSVVLSKSTAKALFGDEDPVEKTITIHGKLEAQVTGVYDDIPGNSQFGEVEFMAPWNLWLSANTWIQNRETDWDNRPFAFYVELQPDVSTDEVNAAINDAYVRNVPPDFYKTIERFKPFPQVVPMSKWHLFNTFENGKPVGGRITYVWLFGIVGALVLALACINFVNLSTARSERRAREVGVRKTMGSGKAQLVTQFMSESFVVVVIAFAVAVSLFVILRPMFNALAGKDIQLPFHYPGFWAASMAFMVFTGLLAGTYPAFYLSSFKPVRALKGNVLSGRAATTPRKVMVVIQFTVSVVLSVGTAVVYQQIDFAQDRPIGYDRGSLLSMTLNQTYIGKVSLLQNELMRSGVVAETSNSSSPVTAIWNTTSGYSWPGKDPSMDAEFAICNVTSNFGKTVLWQMVDGRDFSKDHNTDSLDAIIVNEAAVKYMGLKDPVGQEFVDLDESGNRKWSRTIIGVVKDLVMESPYNAVRPTLYYYHQNALNVLNIRIDPSVSTMVALAKIEAVVNKVVPDAVFSYDFVDDSYAQKFGQELRIGKLSATFALLAMFICCLGLFGLASFIAERRTKEIGVRKILGASVFSLWKLLSKDFVILVVISCVIAVPIVYYVMNDWLQQFQYRTTISWALIAGTCLAATAITLVTVSFQSIRAARANPVTSLRTE